MDDNWVRIGRPGALGSRKWEIERNYDKIYGEWRLSWNGPDDRPLGLSDALQLYEGAYLAYFTAHRDELEWITRNHADVYDNNPSNVASGLDYAIQEFGGNHYQDIAIRRVAQALNMPFLGSGLLEIRTQGAGGVWGPGRIPFHRPELIPQPELPGWWGPGSIESYWQSAKYLDAKRPQVDLGADIYFSTGNPAKVASARVGLGDRYRIAQVELDIDEKQQDVEAIAKHKALVARAVLCRPVIVDDTGFVIPSLGGWPGHHVKRELEKRGLDAFRQLAREGHARAYWIETTGYFDATLAKPLTFSHEVHGTLIGDCRGDLNAPHVKSPLALCFVKDGDTKTVAQWTPQEHRAWQGDRWARLREHLDGVRER